tara:strand:- start:420 stop:1352 length:933 start_codon:yes stop_codon:yes gene_type:complete
MSYSDLAPIGISTYKRSAHLKKTIVALKENPLSRFSDLYIFSDHPNVGDEIEVLRLRKYLKTVTGFKNIEIIERENNSRVKNTREGMKLLLGTYGKMIFLEEDIVTSPRFLEFLNMGLDHYRSNASILSVSGYSPPIRIKKYANSDMYILRRFNAWGFATWQHKFDPYGFELDEKKARNFLENKRHFTESMIGQDFRSMLTKELNKEIDALDVKISFHQVINDLYTVYPIESLVQNIGFDGTGIHCGKSKKFDIDFSGNRKMFNFDALPTIRQEIVLAHNEFRKRNIIQTIRYYANLLFRAFRRIAISEK